MRHPLVGRLCILAGLAAFVAACNQVIDPLPPSTPQTPTTSQVSVALPQNLPPVDSLRIRVELADSPAGAPVLERTVSSLGELVFEDLPAGRNLTIKVQGLAKQSDGTLATWWTASSTILLAGSDSLRSLALTAKVGDTTAPRPALLAAPTPSSSDSLYHLSWSLAESDTVEVWIDGVLVGKATGSFSWSTLWPKGASKVVVALFRDKAGNVSRDTVTVTPPDRVASPTFTIHMGRTETDRSGGLPYLEHYIDSTWLVLQTTTAGAALEYSLDSCRTWHTYTDTLLLTRTLRVHARASKGGLLPSDTTSATYRVYTAMTGIYSGSGSPRPPYVNSIRLDMTTATPGATILFSLDTGRTWSTYRDSLVIARSARVMARSTKAGIADGPTTSVDYEIATATPFFPYPDTLSNDVIPVAIECVTKRAAIVYSLDSGKTWLPYTDELRIGRDVEVWTKATREGTTPSGIAKKRFRIESSIPSIIDSAVAIAPGTDGSGMIFLGYVTVRMSTDLPGATIRYTLDGSDPTESSQLHSGELVIDTSCVLKARIIKDGLPPGPIVTAQYVLALSGTIALNTPDGAVHWWTTRAKLSTDNPDLVLHCTTDGSEATRSSPVCDDSIDVTDGSTIRVAGVSSRSPRLPPVKTDFVFPRSWRNDVAYGTVTDSRDGQRYRTVRMGKQNWMAENLRYAGPDDTIGECPDWIDSNCPKSGRLYDWYQAMAGEASSYAEPSGRKGVCPTGWHIPSKAEWDTLLAFAGSPSATKLKATTSWDSARNGTDEYGFRLLGSGVNFTKTAVTSGSFTVLWTSSHVGVDYGWSARFDLSAAEGVLRESPDLYHLPVRCVED